MGCQLFTWVWLGPPKGGPNQKEVKIFGPKLSAGHHIAMHHITIVQVQFYYIQKIALRIGCNKQTACITLVNFPTFLVILFSPSKFCEEKKIIDKYLAPQLIIKYFYLVYVYIYVSKPP